MTDQSTFRTALLDPDHLPPKGLIDSAGHAAGRRFSVYRNNVTVALGDALLAGFPVIARLLGESNFKSLAAMHLRHSPPTSPMMAQFGKDFPSFLNDFPPLSHLGYLADVAQLECLIRQSYHGEDAAALPAEALQEIAPEDLDRVVLKLAPSMRLLSSNWPVYDIWRINTESSAPKPRTEAQDIAIFRAEFDPVPVLLPPGGHAFLNALQSSSSLGGAASMAVTAAPDFDLATCLGLLLAHNAITDIHMNFHTRKP